MKKIIPILAAFYPLTAALEGTDLVVPNTLSFASLLTYQSFPSGNINVQVTNTQQLLIEFHTIEGFLNQRIGEQATAKIASSVTDGYIDSASMASFGVDMTLDAATFQTNVKISQDIILDSGIYLSATEQPYRYEASTEPFSGYFNLFASFNQDADVDDSAIFSSVNTLESALRFNKFNLTNDFEYSYDEANSNQINRIQSQLTYDFATQGTRVTLGDFTPQVLGFQGSPSLVGLNVNRNFGQIPTRNVRPLTNQRFTIVRASRVEVFVDDILIRRLSLPPGSYDIRDLPLTQGVNNIKLKIIDPSGQEDIIDLSIASSLSLLAAGEFEYHFSTGSISRTDSDGSLDYDTGDVVLSSGIEAGITESLTLGANGQFRDKTYQLGAGITYAFPIGLVELQGAWSDHPVLGNGYASQLTYDSFLDDDIHSLTAQYEWNSLEFTSINDALETLPIRNEDSVEHFLSLFYLYRFNADYSATLSNSTNLTFAGDSDYTIAGALSGPILDTRGTWLFRTTYDSSDDGTDFFFALSFPLSDTADVGFSYDTNLNRIQASYSDTTNPGSTGGYSINARTENNDDQDMLNNVNIDYTGNRYLLAANHIDGQLVDGEYTYRNQINFQTALAFNRHAIAPARPINDAFATIAFHDTLKGAKIGVNPIDGDIYQVRSDTFSTLVVPEITSYAQQTIETDVSNLPAGYTLLNDGYEITPYHRASYHFTIGDDANITVLGSLILSDRTPVALVSASLTPVGKPESKPIEFLTNTKGRFAITGLRPGQYQVKINTADNLSFTLDVPEDEGYTINLGTIKVN
ncbi:fimbria/pilus outer membrane usher protein [Thaumasiovibrio sp. DFM-14]|uniref:fimbria/pilus outer membrane usher protein n=1 Tax=Thaumasiovibrio sp. DFM-14 TaxID=3384792 RepID=UPI0039A01F2F